MSKVSSSSPQSPSDVESIRQARYLALGEHASSIAHDVNTATQYVNDALNFLKLTLSEVTDLLDKYRDHVGDSAADNEGIQNLESILGEYNSLEEVQHVFNRAFSGVKSITRVTKALQLLGREREIEKKEEVLLDPTVEYAVSLVRHRFRYSARFEVSLEADITLLGYSHQLAQLFLNLSTLAAQASQKGNGSTDEITTIRVRSCNRDVPLIEIEYDDDSLGFDENQECYRIAQEIVSIHDGQLSYAQRGRRCTFKVELPCIAKI